MVKVEELSMEAFSPFGHYANLVNPTDEKLGAPPIEFFRDQLQMNMGTMLNTSYSTCRVEKRDFNIDASEYHQCGEGNLPLDNDVYIHVAPATANGEGFPSDKVKVFRIPQGTIVYLKPGVWHHAAFTVNEKPANVLIILPERTYANDCIVEELPPEKQVAFSC